MRSTARYERNRKYELAIDACALQGHGVQMTRGIQKLMLHFLRAHAVSDVQAHRTLVPIEHAELSDAAVASVEQLVSHGILASEQDETAVVRSR